jgi:uncharacterized protein YacL
MTEPAAAEQASQPSRAQRAPYAVLEVLRMLVVVFFAGAGYQVGSAVDSSRPVLGALNGTALGLVLGSGLGYVLGGVLGRKTTATAEQARSVLRDVSADTLVAGSLGLVGGVLLGAGIGWPVFFLPQAYLAFPMFGFLVVLLGYLGFQVGASKRDDVLELFGTRAGLAPRVAGASLLPRVIDTSVAIDGRILDVVRAGFLHGTVLVPTPVLGELQGFADAADDLRRAKGRRGLEALEALKREAGVEVEVLDVDVPGVAEVDAKLVRICLDRGAALLTLDIPLAKAAALAGVQVLNLHALALALRAPVAAGDDVAVQLLKSGKEFGQAVGYLEDGSMVVVERAREHIGSELTVRVTSVLTTSNGRLVFARAAAEPDPVPPPAKAAAAAPRSPAVVLAGPPSPARMPARRGS